MFGILATMVVGLILILGVLMLTTQEGRTAPSAITGLIATDASYDRHGQIDLAWSPSDAKDFAYYSVYASKTEITDVTDLSPVGQTNDRTDVTYQITSYRVSGLSLALFAFADDTEYWFAVTAVDLDGNEGKTGTSTSATIEIMPPASQAPTIFIEVPYKGGFNPETVTVPIGTTIAWTNLDERFASHMIILQPHTVTSDTGLFHGEPTDTNNIFSYTFTEAGVFGYYCELHTGETATVIVK